MMAEIKWRPAIGDPTWLGWIITAAYLISVFFCVRAGLQARRKPNGCTTKDTLMWAAMGAALFLLGVNKQLDLQTAFMELGRQLAQGEGWYQQRRLVQFIFVLGLGIALTSGILIAAIVGRHFFKCHTFALLGSIFLAAFVFLRAVLFNHVGEDTGIRLGEGEWLDTLELAGIFCFIAAGWRAGKYPLRND